jgi:hypothetical protein
VRDAGRAESFRCVRGWGIPLHRGSHPIRRASCRELPEAQQARRHAPPISHATQPVNRRCSLLLLQRSSSSRRRMAGRTYYYYGKACARAPRASQPPDLLRAPTRRATATRRTRLADACLTTRAHGSESDGTVCAHTYSPYVTCRLTALSDGSVLRPERSRPARLALALPRFMAPLETYAVSGREGWQACRARATSTLLGVDPNTLRWTAGFRIHAGPKIFSRTASDSCRIHRYGYLDTPF